MGYEGDKLAPLFAPEPAQITARRMAHHGAEHFRTRVIDNTPIDDSPYPSRPPGTARRSWHVKPVVKLVSLGAEVYETGVFTEDDVAAYLEYGTGLYGPHRRPYVIRPKNPDGMLRFWSRRLGRWVFARSVLHPGIHAQRPLATGAAITEHELAAVLQPDLEEWVRLVEMFARARHAAHGAGRA